MRPLAKLALSVVTFLGLLSVFGRSSKPGGAPQPPAPPTPLADSDEKHVARLNPEVQPEFRALLLHAYELNPKTRIVSSLRSVSEQNRIYAQGRTTEGPIVTHARGCQSWHVLGRAVDLGNLTVAQMRLLGAWWKDRGGKWGGDFPKMFDGGHFEFHPNLTIEQACPDPDAVS